MKEISRAVVWRSLMSKVASKFVLSSSFHTDVKWDHGRGCDIPYDIEMKISSVFRLICVLY